MRASGFNSSRRATKSAASVLPPSFLLVLRVRVRARASKPSRVRVRKQEQGGEGARWRGGERAWETCTGKEERSHNGRSSSCGACRLVWLPRRAAAALAAGIGTHPSTTCLPPSHTRPGPVCARA